MAWSTAASISERMAKPREAKGGEIDRLLERGAVQELPEVSIGVTIDGAAHAIVVNTSQTLDHYLNRASQRLLDALPKPERESTNASPVLASALSPHIATQERSWLKSPIEWISRTQCGYFLGLTRATEQAKAAKSDDSAGCGERGLIVRSVWSYFSTFAFEDVQHRGPSDSNLLVVRFGSSSSRNNVTAGR